MMHQLGTMPCFYRRIAQRGSEPNEAVDAARVQRQVGIEDELDLVSELTAVDFMDEPGLPSKPRAEIERVQIVKIERAAVGDIRQQALEGRARRTVVVAINPDEQQNLGLENLRISGRKLSSK